MNCKDKNEDDKLENGFDEGEGHFEGGLGKASIK